MIIREFDNSLVAQALEDNMSGKFAYLPALVHDMFVRESEGVTLINSNESSDMFNIICKTQANNLPELQQAINFFNDENLPFSWWVGFKNEPMTLSEQLATLHCAKTENELGMAIVLSELPEKLIYPHLMIQQVDNEIQLNHFVKVLTDLIPDEKIPIENFYSRSKKHLLTEKSLLKLFVGYLNDKPVATSALFCYAGVAGIWDIVTLPDARRKGIGTDMTLHALSAGKNCGFLVGVLTASDEGQFVYRKLGFKPMQQFFVYNKVE